MLMIAQAMTWGKSRFGVTYCDERIRALLQRLWTMQKMPRPR
jgi:hypothetical protein